MPLGPKQMKIKFLEDGTLSIETGNFAGESHKKADEFLQMVKTLMGGPVKTISTKGQLEQHHHHAHGEMHHHH